METQQDGYNPARSVEQGNLGGSWGKGSPGGLIGLGGSWDPRDAVGPVGAGVPRGLQERVGPVEEDPENVDTVLDQIFAKKLVLLVDDAAPSLKMVSTRKKLKTPNFLILIYFLV